MSRRRKMRKRGNCCCRSLSTALQTPLQMNRLNMGIAQHEKLGEYLKEISSQSILLPSDWPYYIHEVDHIFDQRISELSALKPQLTLPDIIVITLLCLRLDIRSEER